MLHTLAFQMPSFMEMAVIMAIGLVLFGKRLPEVGKNIGKGIVEFKKGLKGIEDEVEASSSASSQKDPLRTAPPYQPTQVAIAAPAHKFDPFTGKPLDQSSAQPVEQETRVGM